jgi:hypothetical protein
MELELIRAYFSKGTNGELFYNGKRLCYTIELPWRDNMPRVSCIPEGTYELYQRHSGKFGWHIGLKYVDGREAILIHPANDALKELKGCIAPVSILTDQGKGSQSRVAFEKVKNLVYKAIKEKDLVFLTIKSNQDEAE